MRNFRINNSTILQENKLEIKLKPIIPSEFDIKIISLSVLRLVKRGNNVYVVATCAYYSRYGARRKLNSNISKSANQFTFTLSQYQGKVSS